MYALLLGRKAAAPLRKDDGEEAEDQAHNGAAASYAGRISALLESASDESADTGQIFSDARAVVAEIDADAGIDKATALDIAEQVGVIRINRRSRAAAIESIDAYVVWFMNNIDADRMARRATPW